MSCKLCCGLHVTNVIECKVDGDEMYICSIKESNMVKDMMGIHPSTCMIGADRLELTGDLDITVQQHTVLSAWLNEGK